MEQSQALLVAGIVFGIVAMIHVLRLIFKFDIIVAGKRIPLWANWLGLVVAGGLCAWMLMVR